MTTMADVAREAGVSMTTVSHVLNGTRPVNEKTTKRVHAAIERTGYRPNSIARALAGARTQSIGLAISGISNPYFMDVIAAIEAEAAKHGFTILLGDTHDEPQKELQMVQELVLRHVDGLLLAPSPGAQDKALKYLSQQSAPVVLVDRFLPLEVDQVGTENEQPAAELVGHMIELGHRRIGLVAGLQGLSTTEERIRGFRQALEHAGIPTDSRLIAHGASQHEPARAAVHRLLDLRDPPTALVAGNNAMTIGVLHALRERGLSVPDDIALVGFDDFAWSDLFHPRLTVIAQPTAAIGSQAVQLLLARLEEPTAPVQKMRLTPTLVHRDSCGCGLSNPRGDLNGKVHDGGV
jgi:LacI family transcriptional regulator, galactose operon repressor